MRILVTGGAGFIGSHVVDALVTKHHQVTVVDNLSTGSLRNLNPRASFIKADITGKRLPALFQKIKPVIVYHLAAQLDLRASLRDPVGDAKSNILGTVNVLECCRIQRVKKVLFASTAAVYGHADKRPTPEDTLLAPYIPYGAAKRACEQYFEMYHRAYGVKSVILRMSNVYGPRQNHKGEAGVVAIFAHRVRARKPCRIYGDGTHTRDFVYVADVVDAFLRGLRKGGGVYNISTATETSINDLYQQITMITGGRESPRHVPAIRSEVKRSALSNARARKDLGWKPKVGLEEGLQKTLEYFKSM